MAPRCSFGFAVPSPPQSQPSFCAQGQAEKLLNVEIRGETPGRSSPRRAIACPQIRSYRTDLCSRPPLIATDIRPCMAAPSLLHTCTHFPHHSRISVPFGPTRDTGIIAPRSMGVVAVAECHSSRVTSAAATCSPLSLLPKPRRAQVKGVSGAHREEVEELLAEFSRLPRVPPDPWSALTAASGRHVALWYVDISSMSYSWMIICQGACHCMHAYPSMKAMTILIKSCSIVLFWPHKHKGDVSRSAATSKVYPKSRVVSRAFFTLK